MMIFYFDCLKIYYKTILNNIIYIRPKIVNHIKADVKLIIYNQYKLSNANTLSDNPIKIAPIPIQKNNIIADDNNELNK